MLILNHGAHVYVGKMGDGAVKTAHLQNVFQCYLLTIPVKMMQTVHLMTQYTRIVQKHTQQPANGVHAGYHRKIRYAH